MFVAKNKSGETILFYKKPKRKSVYWLSVDGKYFNIDSTIFPKLKWEDEPVEVIFLKEL